MGPRQGIQYDSTELAKAKPNIPSVTLLNAQNQKAVHHMDNEPAL